jgi:hypothetical protein
VLSTIAIVGGVSGGVFLLAVLGDIYVWYRRRQRRATGEASMFNPYPMSGSDTARPFAQLSGPYATMGYFARTRKRDLGATGEVPRPSRAKRGTRFLRRFELLDTRIAGFCWRMVHEAHRRLLNFLLDTRRCKVSHNL